MLISLELHILVRWSRIRWRMCPCIIPVDEFHGKGINGIVEENGWCANRRFWSCDAHLRLNRLLLPSFSFFTFILVAIEACTSFLFGITLLGTHAMFFLLSSCALRFYNSFFCQYDKLSGHVGCDFVSTNGNSFWALCTLNLFYSDLALWFLSIDCFTSLPFVANVNTLIGSLLFEIKSKVAHLWPSLFMR